LRAIDQDVDRAERPYSGVDQVADLALLGDVGRNADRLRAQILELGSGPLAAMRLPLGDHDARAFLGELVGDTPTDSLTGARDDRDLPAEPIHGTPPPGSIEALRARTLLRTPRCRHALRSLGARDQPTMNGSVSQPRMVDVHDSSARSKSTLHLGKRSRISSSATRASSRASAAPRQ